MNFFPESEGITWFYYKRDAPNGYANKISRCTLVLDDIEKSSLDNNAKNRYSAQVLKKIGFVNAARIYFTGEDLWESTKISDGWDPEAKRNASGTQRYPFTRNFTFGMNLTF